MGDRHFDLCWALWSLNYNLKTPRFNDRLLDAYGRDAVDDLRRAAGDERGKRHDLAAVFVTAGEEIDEVLHRAHVQAFQLQRLRLADPAHAGDRVVETKPALRHRSVFSASPSSSML